MIIPFLTMPIIMETKKNEEHKHNSHDDDGCDDEYDDCNSDHDDGDGNYGDDNDDDNDINDDDNDGDNDDYDDGNNDNNDDDWDSPCCSSGLLAPNLTQTLGQMKNLL